MDLSYIINHLGEERESYMGAVSPPIFQTVNFAYSSISDMRQALKKEMEIPFYTRGHNPTVSLVQKKIAALEGSESCLLFGSGSAAIAAGMLSFLSSGDHIVCVDNPYSWTSKLIRKFLSRFQVRHTFVDGSNPDNFRQAILPETKLIMLESPNSMTFSLQDIEAIVRIAKKHQIAVLLDNSYATPLNQRAFQMGVDMTFHSATKYLAGHSDLVAGALCCRKAHATQIFESEYMTLGAVISPHDAWLLLRGLRTLPLRLEHIGKATPQIATFLEKHPLVKRVNYPFLPSFPDYELAKKQLASPGGMLSILLDVPDLSYVDLFCDSLSHFLLAASWGSYESLIYPASVLYDSQNYSSTSLPWNLIRIYIGLEDPSFLIRDLEYAFQTLENALNEKKDS